MVEFVFLPDREVSPRSSIESLTKSMSSVARLAVGPSMANFTGPGAGRDTSDSLFDLVSQSVAASASAAPETAQNVEMLDLVEKTGVVLMRGDEMPEEDQMEGGTIVPVYHYSPAIAEARVGRTKKKLNSGPAAADFLRVKLRFKDDNTPVVGAVANLRPRGGDEISAVSDQNGVVTFPLRAPNVQNARFMVEPGFAGHWGHFDRRASFGDGDTFQIERIDLDSAIDPLRHLVEPGNLADGAGVRVAVVDSGVGPHADLPNASGDRDTSSGHGSHVAGIIGGRGAGQYVGVAPGVEIQSYRVFNDLATGLARNFEIHRAIEQAIDDGCQIINLSLKSEIPARPAVDDLIISRAIEDAADAGVLCVAAAGNDFRRFVAFPARHPDAIAVSALGWEPGMPVQAYDSWTIAGDRSTIDRDVYFSNFSNEGVSNTDVDLTGPGAAVVSTVPGNTYAPMSGTSMACPAIVGAIARLVSANPQILAMSPNRARTNAMLMLIENNKRDAGFNKVKQGEGTLA